MQGTFEVGDTVIGNGLYGGLNITGRKGTVKSVQSDCALIRFPELSTRLWSIPYELLRIESKPIQQEKCVECGREYLNIEKKICSFCDNYFDHREISMSFKKSRKKGKIITVNRLVGVEIEAGMSGVDHALFKSLLPDENGLGMDGGGVEVRTPPRSMGELEEFMGRTCEALQKTKHRPLRSCGLHIHFDFRKEKRDFKKLGQLVKFMWSIEDLLVASVPQSRRSNGACPHFAKRQGITSLEVNNKDSVSSILCTSSRFGSNFHCIFSQDTFESRYHEGTIDADEILHWTGFLLKCIDYALKHYREKQITQLNTFPLGSRSKRYFLYEITKMESHLWRYFEKRIEVNAEGNAEAALQKAGYHKQES